MKNMKSYHRILIVFLAVLLLSSVSVLPVLAADGNPFGIRKYVALGDSFAAGLNEDPELGKVPKVSTGEVDENGEEIQVEVFGTSQAGYATQLAKMLNLKGAGRVDQNRPDDGYRSWAFCGMRTKDLLYYLDPTLPHDDEDLYFLQEGAQSNYKLYLDDMAEDIRNADLITLGIGGNDFFTAPLWVTLLEMADEQSEEEETLALNEALKIAEEEEDAADSLEQITELLDTVGLLTEFMARFSSKMAVGYAEMVENFPKIIEKLRTMNPNGQIVLDHVPNPLSAWSLTGSSAITIGEILGTVVVPANLVIDATAAKYNCEVVETVDVEIGDGLHPTIEGYRTIAQRTYDVLRNVDSSFRDVEKGTWYSDAVAYVTEKGMMAGTGDRMFSPDAAVTRGMAAQILYAQEGRPEVSSSAGFRDVPNGKWYSDAVNWCVANKLAAGYLDNTFRPNQAITRQQLAAILYRHAAFSGKDTAPNGNLILYADRNEVADYAVEAMKWAVGHRLISGTGTKLEPNGTATRAQMAVILQQYDKL